MKNILFILVNLYTYMFLRESFITSIVINVMRTASNTINTSVLWFLRLLSTEATIVCIAKRSVCNVLLFQKTVQLFFHTFLLCSFVYYFSEQDKFVFRDYYLRNGCT